jgi:2-methylisocitrate lyase-like PEP mutase family enzyme
MHHLEEAMSRHELESLAARFHALHRGPDLLMLANAWDAGSALLMESIGARAIATTSAGVAWCHGYPDGNSLPATLAVATAAEIARAVGVPVSIDFEGGYSDDPETVAKLVRTLIDVGVVGINIEDGSSSPDQLCRKLEAVRRMSSSLGVDLFVNARTDVYLRELVPASGRVTETRLRAARYRDAGASGLFVPGLVETGEIASIAREVALPLNVMSAAGLASPVELARLGVRRLSAGSAIAEATWGHLRALASAFLRDGSGLAAVDGAMSYTALNALMAAHEG